MATSRKKIIIVGERKEADRVYNIIRHSLINPELVGYVFPFESESDESHYIGNIKQLKDIVVVNRVDEIVFCAKNLKRVIFFNFGKAGAGVQFLQSF